MCLLLKVKLPKIACAILWMAFPPILQANDLSEIKSQIQQQEEKIAEQKKTQNTLQNTLKKQEQEINKVLSSLDKMDKNLAETNLLIKQTETQIANLIALEKAQKDKLAKQLDSTYRHKNDPSVMEKLMSEDAQNVERMRFYYEHLNRSRVEQIKNLKNIQAELATQQQQISTQQQAQQKNRAKRQQQQITLEKIQTEHQNNLKVLNQQLVKDQDRLKTLRQNERALLQEIKRAEIAAQELDKQQRESYAQKKQEQEKINNKPYQPTAEEQRLINSGGGLGRPNKQYKYPVAGRQLNQFGTVQVGELLWKGILIAAPVGSDVFAISSGRVILSDWLQGYGLVVVIDHGKDDMSLYGYNQKIDVKTGSIVKAGQKIAEVGSNSNGQQGPSLYFEIRRKGQAINPVAWLK